MKKEGLSGPLCWAVTLPGWEGPRASNPRRHQRRRPKRNRSVSAIVESESDDE